MDIDKLIEEERIIIGLDEKNTKTGVCWETQEEKIKKEILNKYYPDDYNNLPEKNQLKWLESEFKNIKTYDDISGIIKTLYERSGRDTFKDEWKTKITCSNFSDVEFYKSVMVLLGEMKNSVETNEFSIELVIKSLVSYLDHILIKKEGDKDGTE
jgi:hypothetical protein